MRPLSFFRYLDAAPALRALCLIAPLLLIGCGKEQTNDPGGDLTSIFNGSIDPATGAAVLRQVTLPGSGGLPLTIVLLGRNVRTEPVIDTGSDPIGSVDLLVDVSIRNEGSGILYAPAELTVSQLDTRVLLLGADWTACPRCLDTTPRCSCSYGLSYLQLLGDDNALSPGEESGARTWRFRLSESLAFSFAVNARFGSTPDRPHLAGVTFHDPNENGQRDPGEFPMTGVTLQLTGPGLESLVVVAVDEHGFWSYPIGEPGLYTILATPPPTFAPVHFTTPNPLQVVIAPAENGKLESFDAADFGIANDIGDQPVPIQYADTEAGIPQDHWLLVNVGLSGTVLSLNVGFSGCGPDHPLALYWVGPFMESNPVQARLVLSHDSRGEACDAYFTRLVATDLTPIRTAYRRQYGQSGPILLNLVMPNGESKQFRLEAE